MLNSIISWVTQNRFSLLRLGSASYRLSQAVLTCWSLYMAIRQGDPTVTGWAIAQAIGNLVSAGTDVTLGVITLYRTSRENGKGAPTADNDRAPFRQ